MKAIRTRTWHHVTALIVWFASVLLTAPAIHAQNLIRNGQFDTDNLSEFTFRPMRDKGSRAVHDSHAGLFVETLTGNRCYRIDLDRYVQDKNGKTIHAAIAVGGAKGYDFQDGQNAITVEPDTTYNVSFEYRGTIKNLGIKPIFYRGNANGYDQMDHTGKADPATVQVSDIWTPYHGSFTTHADSTHAVLRLNVYTHEQYRITETPGTYVMIDNLVIEKAQSVLDQLGQQPEAATMDDSLRVGAALVLRSHNAMTIDGQFDEPAWTTAPKNQGFRKLRTDEPETVNTVFRVLAGDDALYVAIQCEEPTPLQMRLTVTDDGGQVYKDDSIELFAVDSQGQGPMSQFIINATGTRFVSVGGTPLPADARAFEQWRAAVHQTPTGWQAELALPYELLGLKGKPNDGDQLKFNVARNRYADPSPHSSWMFMQGNFRDTQRFGYLVFGSLKTNLIQQIEVLKHRVSALDSKTLREQVKTLEKTLADLKARVLGEVNATDWRDVKPQLDRLAQQIDIASAGSRPFAVSLVSPTDRFEVPYLPKSFVPVGKTIEAQASVNEFESFPIAITNLTDRVETYRVVLFRSEDNGTAEVEGLSTHWGDTFPSAQIHQQEAIAVRSGDSAQAGRQLDPLAPMGPARTIQVMPKQASVVWFTFDCRDVKPGTYQATLRVIPLSEPGVFKRDAGPWRYQGAMQDVPTRLTVWPIVLSKKALMPTWLMRGAPNQQFYTDMIEHGNTHFQVSPWHFPAKIDDQGNVTPGDLTPVKRQLSHYITWASQHPDAPAPACVIGFSAYRVFNEQWARKRFRVGSTAWNKAWAGWLRMVEDTLLNAGFSPKQCIVELWDEPKHEDQDEVIASLKVARQTCSQIELMVTLGASFQSPPQIQAMVPYVDGLCVWGLYLTDARYTQLFDQLQKQGKFLWFYLCDTNLRVDAYRYYRLHGWRAWTRGLDGLGLFRYMSGPGGHYGGESWKAASLGSLAYNAGGLPITSIRFEALREGFDDIKYLDKLRNLLQNASPAMKQRKAYLQAQKLLKEQVPQVVERFSHDPTRAQTIRIEAASLIMQLQP